MIRFKAINSFLIQNASELPTLPDRITRLYMDFETTSRDEKLTSLNPWKTCWPIGAAITWDGEKSAIFVPIKFQAFIAECLHRTHTWVNHNVKYDAHVFDLNIERLPKHIALFDTITMAKLLDSERQFTGGYSLDALAKSWLHEDITTFEARLKPYLKNNKDYGRIPIDILAEYACVDVLTNRKLDYFIQRQLPKPCYDIKNIEKANTKTLFKIERRGFYVNKSDLLAKYTAVQQKLLDIVQELHAQFGFYIEPHVPNDCKKLLCDMLNLPVLRWTVGGKPGFDKKTLKKYLVYEDHRKIIEALLLYRKLATFKSGFIVPIIKYNLDSITHSFYTQLVRTGRMSCKRPNVQAMSKIAKGLIKPRDGYGFIVTDFSQIEFRLIVHFAQELEAIEAYQQNPEQDFHQFVADIANIDREFAKTLNFATAYGQGERSTLELLSTAESVQKAVRDEGTTLDKYVNNLREKYFTRFQRILPTARKKQLECKLKGYSENAYGRRRHLATDSRKAFNSIVQGTAADIMKEVMNNLSEACDEHDIHLLAVVHDELVMEVPVNILNEASLHRDIARVMESPSVDFDVAMKIQLGTSTKSWMDAKSEMKFVPYSEKSLEFMSLCRNDLQKI